MWQPSSQCWAGSIGRGKVSSWFETRRDIAIAPLICDGQQTRSGLMVRSQMLASQHVSKTDGRIARGGNAPPWGKGRKSCCTKRFEAIQRRSTCYYLEWMPQEPRHPTPLRHPTTRNGASSTLAQRLGSRREGVCSPQLGWCSCGLTHLSTSGQSLSRRFA